MNLKPLAVLLALGLLLAGCGNKGPLVRPSQTPPVEAPAPSDTTPPADGATTPPADNATPPATPPADAGSGHD